MGLMAEQEAAAVRSPKGTNEYIVLRESDDRGGWWQEFVERGPVSAKNRRDAIAQATASLDDKSGTFVAVPLCGWKPMP